MVVSGLTDKIIGAAIEVHKALGPGLLESAYEECLAHELSLARICFERQVPLPITYRSIQLDCGYRLDFLVDRTVVLELKALESLQPIHEAQLLTLSKIRRMANRVAYQFQRACSQEGYQANGL